MGTISLQIPQIGQPDTTEDVKLANGFTTLQTVINGNLDATNISATLAQSASVNQSGQTVKGASIIATSESRTNVAYGLMPTPDQVTGIVLPANGLIKVRYQATWQESVGSAARAAIFIGTNQLKVIANSANPVTQAAVMGGPTATNNPLFSHSGGLTSWLIGYGGDVTTGQALGSVTNGSTTANMELNGSVVTAGSAVTLPVGGKCEIFGLPAGTYSVSVQFKASSGSVTASNRRLYVEAVSFS